MTKSAKPRYIVTDCPPPCPPHVRAHVLLTMASYPKQLLVQLTELAISLRNDLLDVNIFKP